MTRPASVRRGLLLGCDLDVEVQDSGAEKPVESAAGSGLRAAERGGELGDGTAAVQPEFGEEPFVLGIEDIRPGSSAPR